MSSVQSWRIKKWHFRNVKFKYEAPPIQNTDLLTFLLLPVRQIISCQTKFGNTIFQNPKLIINKYIFHTDIAFMTRDYKSLSQCIIFYILYFTNLLPVRWPACEVSDWPRRCPDCLWLVKMLSWRQLYSLRCLPLDDDISITKISYQSSQILELYLFRLV